MPILVSIFVVSFVLYFYFKVRVYNYKDIRLMEISNAKARIALGTFVISFMFNQYLFYQVQWVLWLTLLLTALGIAQIVHGIKVYRHYLQQIKAERD